MSLPEQDLGVGIRRKRTAVPDGRRDMAWRVGPDVVMQHDVGEKAFELVRGEEASGAARHLRYGKLTIK